MNINDYKFEVGDVVITTSGMKGKIDRICDCEACRERGFFEPVWVIDGDESGNENYITYMDAELNFFAFYRIGKYRFRDFDKDALIYEIKHCQKIIDDRKKRLEFMDKVESGGD